MPDSESVPPKRASKLSVIKCECGKEILIVPDVNEMARAIQYHAEDHQKSAKTAEEGISAFERTQDLLITQLLKKVSSEKQKK